MDDTQSTSNAVANNAVFALSGAYGLAEAAELKQNLTAVLDAARTGVRLNLDAVESGGIVFFQLLFSFAAQARLDGIEVVLDLPLPEPLRQAAGELGLTQRDFEQAFSHEVSG